MAFRHSETYRFRSREQSNSEIYHWYFPNVAANGILSWTLNVTYCCNFTMLQNCDKTCAINHFTLGQSSAQEATLNTHTAERHNMRKSGEDVNFTATLQEQAGFFIRPGYLRGRKSFCGSIFRRMC